MPDSQNESDLQPFDGTRCKHINTHKLLDRGIIYLTTSVDFAILSSRSIKTERFAGVPAGQLPNDREIRK